MTKQEEKYKQYKALILEQLKEIEAKLETDPQTVTWAHVGDLIHLLEVLSEC